MFKVSILLGTGLFQTIPKEKWRGSHMTYQQVIKVSCTCTCNTNMTKSVNALVYLLPW